ncbi:MAG: hypothetical protein H0T92_13940 [Pyrinomonadaceae bacterium]|nr:hypothetical protein [Pyrinomonadaceae bacterium]
MRLKLYCNRYEHFKDPLVCSVNCVYRTRCQDFALFYDERRDEIDALVADYYQTRSTNEPRSASPAPIATVADVLTLIRLEVKKEMSEVVYIWIGADDRAELVETEEVLRRAERGAKAKHIYKVAQEMELRFQLVPRKRIEKAKRIVAVEAERAASRRSRLRPVTTITQPDEDHRTPMTPITSTEQQPATPVRPRRSRVAKASG